MIQSIQKLSKSLSPSEHLIIKCVCTGQSNVAISETTSYSIKCIENSISRSAKILGVVSGPDVNLRVLLVIAYRANFPDPTFDPVELAVKHLRSL